MINKELLSEVLGFSIGNCWNDGNLVVWEEDGMSEINIYELAHKCKEWAANKGYYVVSMVKFHCYLFTVTDFLEKPCYKVNWDFSAGTRSESEAIFRACEWILKETK